MLIFFAVIVVDVRGDRQFAQGSKRCLDPLGFRAIGKMRVADVEVEAEARQTRFVNEGAEIGWIAHLASSVLDGDRYSAMVRVQNQMLERAERRVAFPGVRCFSRTSHVQDQT